MTNTINLFEVATRQGLRFPFKGQISTEDLWTLSVENLDTIFKTLNSEQKKVSEESLLNVKSSEDEELDTKIKIIKHIVSVKIEESNARLKEKEIKNQKQKLMELIEAKKDEGLQNKSLEELQEELNKLES